MQKIMMEDLRGNMWAEENKCGCSALRDANLIFQNVLYGLAILFHEKCL